MMMREALIQLQDWRSRSYPDSKLVLMEKIMLRWHGRAGIKAEELRDAILDVIGEWTGAGVPDVGDFRKRIYLNRAHKQREGRQDPTSNKPELRLGGHDGHGNRFLSRAELTNEMYRLKKECPKAWDPPSVHDSYQEQADRIYRKAVETGLNRSD